MNSNSEVMDCFRDRVSFELSLKEKEYYCSYREVERPFLATEHL